MMTVTPISVAVKIKANQPGINKIRICLQNCSPHHETVDGKIITIWRPQNKTHNFISFKLNGSVLHMVNHTLICNESRRRSRQ